MPPRWCSPRSQRCSKRTRSGAGTWNGSSDISSGGGAHFGGRPAAVGGSGGGVGGGDVERLVVHLVVGDVPLRGQAGGDRVVGEERGDAGRLAGLAPGGEDAVGEADGEGDGAVGVGGLFGRGGEGRVLLDGLVV